MVNAFIVGEAPAITGVFEQHLSQREHSVVCVEIQQLALPPADADGDSCSIVIADCAGQLAGRTLAFPVFQQLVDVCMARGWPLLMLSDSRVFPSVKNQRYRERDVSAPVVPAGLHLQECERYLAENSERHVILRTGPLLATGGINLLTALVRQMQAGGNIPAATEPRFAPTVLADLARVVAAICDQIDCAAQCWGAYHYNSADTATPYELAEAVLAAASQYWNLGDAVHLQADARAAWGSEYPLLSCQKIRDTFGIQQLQWRKAIPDLLKQMQTGGQK